MATKLIPDSWMPNVKFDGIVMHWTAGNHIASTFDKSHYHFGVDGPGLGVWRGVPLEKNAKGRALPSGDYAAHTAWLNGGWIGFTQSCMGSFANNPATENNFVNIAYPMTKQQWETAIKGAAELCVKYKIPVQRPTKQDPRGVQSHAEVEANLGLTQAGKWDFTRLSWKPELQGARIVGDFMRRQIKEQVDLMEQAEIYAAHDSQMLPPEEPQFETTKENIAQADPALPNPPTPKPAAEPMSGFRKWIAGATSGGIGSVILGWIVDSWAKLAMLDFRIWIAVIVTAAFFGTIIFALVWLFPRPIVIEKDNA